MSTPQTLKQAEEYAAANGILLSPADRQRIGAIQTSERERLASLATTQEQGWTDWWKSFYPRLLQTILSIGETLLTFSQTLIVSFGVPLVLLLLLIVEHQRVVHGIQLFEKDMALASFAAAALVILNLVLEFQIHHIEHVSGYHEERGKRWSLWIWWQNTMYTLGIGDTWNVQYLSPAARYKKLLRLVTFSILALALVGSMKTVMDTKTTAWNEAVVSIITTSTLTELMTWIGGLLFAAAAVLSAQGLSRYVAIRCVEIIAEMKAQQPVNHADTLQAEIDQAGANAAMAIINEKITVKRKKAATAQRSETPAVETPYKEVETLPNGLPFGDTALAWALGNPEGTVMNGHANGNGNGGMIERNGNGNHEK